MQLNALGAKAGGELGCWHEVGVQHGDAAREHRHVELVLGFELSQ